MKVLLCHNAYQRPGGEDIVFAAECALLEAHGHQVVRYQRHNDDVDALRAPDLFRRTIWNPRTVADLGDLIAAERPDVMHCHNTFPLLSPSAYDAARRFSVPVVQTLHNYRLICPKAELLRDGAVCERCVGKRIAWPAIVHACYRGSRPASAAVAAMLSYHRQRGTWDSKVDRYIVPTAFVKRKMVEGGLPAERITVKPNFVAEDPGVGRGAGDYAVFVGRLSPEKGVRCLLEAWKRMPGGLGLKIVGDGPLADEVATAAANDSRITWLGHQARAAVHAAMKDARVLIMPSLWYETFGLCIAEAFANGTPVIASRLGAMAELVEEGRTGFLVAPDRPGALADTVAAATADPRTLRDMRPAARADYEQHYTVDINYRLLMDIYEAAKNARSAARRSDLAS